MEYTRLVGWDVHATTIAVAEAGRQPGGFEGSFPATPEAVRHQPNREDGSAGREGLSAGFMTPGLIIVPNRSTVFRYLGFDDNGVVEVITSSTGVSAMTGSARLPLRRVRPSAF